MKLLKELKNNKIDQKRILEDKKFNYNIIIAKILKNLRRKITKIKIVILKIIIKKKREKKKKRSKF